LPAAGDEPGLAGGETGGKAFLSNAFEGFMSLLHEINWKIIGYL
jgi:hypothetical protein